MCSACTHSSWKALEREYCLEIGSFMYPCADTDTAIKAVKATPPITVVVAGDILIPLQYKDGGTVISRGFLLIRGALKM